MKTPDQFNLVYNRSLTVAVMVVVCLVYPLTTTAQSSTNPLGTLIFEAGTLVPAEPGNAPPANEGTSRISESAATTSPDAIKEYRNAISGSLETGSSYSPLLSEQYEALGILLFQSGNYEDAIVAFEDAIHIQKVNKGLFNLDQSRLVEYLVHTHTALGDFDAVDNHKHYLYYLQVKSLAEDDPRLIAAKLDWADWNVETFVKGYRNSFSHPVALTDSVRNAQGFQNRVSIDVPVRRPVDGSISSPGGAPAETVTDTVPVSINVPMLNSNSVVTNAAVTDYNLRSIPYALSKEIVVNQRLHDAEDIYEDLLEQAENNSNVSLTEQKDLHLRLANLNYLLKKELEQYETITDRGSIAYNRVNQEYTSDASMMADRRYINTKNSFTDLVEEIEQSPDTSALDKANAYIELGDMHLSFERPQRAFDAYGKAHEILQASGYSAAAIDLLLTPSPDLAVPAYGLHNFSRAFYGISPDTDIPYRGHIDVAFSKDRFGSANGINVLGSSSETPAQVQSALINYLRNQHFRPALAGGEAVEHNDIRLRYYYYY